MTPVLTKYDFHRRWMAMEFGNRPQVFNAEDVCSQTCLVNVRYAEADSNKKAYRIQPWNALRKAINLGGDLAKYSFEEAMPLERQVMQGELVDSPEGLFLAFVAKPNNTPQWRDELSHATGISALGVLKRTLDPQDVTELRELLEAYPGHVIEFGAYRTRVGVLNRRMVIFEVRKY